MQFPLSLLDISLVFGVVAMVLLITSELSSSYRERNLAIEKKILERTALIFGFAFLFTTIFEILQILSVV